MPATYLGSSPIRTRKSADGNSALSVAIDGNDGTPIVKEVTVGTSATQLVASSTKRRSLLIVNNGTAVVFIAPDNTAAPGHGVPLPQYGYLYDDSTLSAWWGVVSTGTGDIRILEVD